MAHSDRVRSLLKALDILEAAGRSPHGLRAGELAEAAGLKTTTAHNLIRTLASRGYLAKGAMSCYRLGPALEDMVRFQARRAVWRQAEAALRMAGASAREAIVTFSEWTGSEIVCRLRWTADGPDIVQQPSSMTFQPFDSASGLCLQAFDSSCRAHWSAPGLFEEFGSRHWETREAFDAALAETAERGMAVLRKKARWLMAVPVGTGFALGVNATMNEKEAKRMAGLMKELAVKIASGATEDRATCRQGRRTNGEGDQS